MLGGDSTSTVISIDPDLDIMFPIRLLLLPTVCTTLLCFVFFSFLVFALLCFALLCFALLFDNFNVKHTKTGFIQDYCNRGGRLSPNITRASGDV